MTTETKTYNGWTNYETWCIKLWMDNDQADSDDWDSQAQDMLNNDSLGNEFVTAERQRVHLLSDDLKAQYYDQAPELNGCYADLLSASLSSINWYEIAEHLLADNV